MHWAVTEAEGKVLRMSFNVTLPYTLHAVNANERKAMIFCGSTKAAKYYCV